MKKIISVLFLFTILIINVNASEKDIINFINDFQSEFNKGNASSINYFEKEEHKEEIKKYLGNSTISLGEYKVEKQENNYLVKAVLNANGKNNGSWSTSGFTAKFTIKENNEIYIITDTTLFEHMGSENIMKSVLTIFGIVFGSIGIISIIIVITIITISKKAKRKQQDVQINGGMRL